MPFYFDEPENPWKPHIEDEKAVKVSGDFGIHHESGTWYRISEARRLHENLGEVLKQCDRWIEQQQRLANGTEVATTKSAGATDWTEEALRTRQWGRTGEVIGYHDSHGLVYDVRHCDGTIGCYETEELRVL